MNNETDRYQEWHDTYRNTSDEKLELRVRYDRDLIADYLEDRNFKTLAAAVIRPIYAAKSKFRQAARYGYQNRQVALYVPMTDELVEAAGDTTLQQHLSDACKDIVRRTHIARREGN